MRFALLQDQDLLRRDPGGDRLGSEGDARRTGTDDEEIENVAHFSLARVRMHKSSVRN